MNAYSNIIHKIQKVRLTQTSISWTKLKNVVYPYNWILFTIQRREVLILATTWIHLENIEWKQPNTKDFIWFDSIYQKCVL